MWLPSIAPISRIPCNFATFHGSRIRSTFFLSHNLAFGRLYCFFFFSCFEHGFNWHFIVLYFCINLMNSLQMTIWRLVEYIVARENVSKSSNKKSHSCRALWITSTPTVHFQLPNTVLRMTLSFAEIKGHCHTKLSSDSAWTAKNNCVYGLFFFCQP